MAQVEMVVTGLVRIVTVITGDGLEDLDLQAGMATGAVVISTFVMLEQ
jgi:hypothetical protein